MILQRNILLVVATLVYGTLTATAQSESQFRGHSGLDLNVELGPDFGLQKGGGTSFSAKLDVGKKFNKNFYFGLGGGISTGEGVTTYPIFGTLRTYLPSTESKIIPTAAIRGGYVLDSDCPFIAIAPGIIFPISESIDLTAGLEYTASFMDGMTGHTLGVHVGLGIHKNTNGIKKEWAPTREHGLQYVIDASSKSPWSMGTDNGNISLNIAAMYKYDNNISFGLGFGFGGGRWPCEVDYEDDANVNPTFYDVFLRGKYRMNADKISPFASVDVGIRMLEDMDDNKSSVVYITPAVGISFKVAGNSYIDVKAGYEIGSSAVEENEYIKAKSCNGITIGVSFTHTMNLLTDGIF